MKKILCLAVVIILFSCDAFKPKQEFRFVFGFENETAISNIELLQTIEVIKKRLNNYGLQNSVKRFGEKNIEVNIKAIALDIDRVDKLISNSGKLEFWELYKGTDLFGYLYDITSEVIENNDEDGMKIKTIFDLEPKTSYRGAAEVIKLSIKDTSKISSLLDKNENRIKLSLEQKYTKFLWGIPDDKGYISLYAAKSNRENKAPLTGEVITYASQNYGYNDNPEISIEMNKKGALIWERMTEKAFQNKTCIAITLNDIVYSAPGVTSGPITGGRSSVSGNFTLEEARDLAVILSSGQSIPKLKLLEHAVIKNR